MSGGVIRQHQPARPYSSLVLLWGVPEEEPLAAVHGALRACGTETIMVDQRRALSTHLLPHSTGPVLRLPDRTVPLAEVTGAYPRPYPFIPVISEGSPAHLVARRHVVRLERELWQWTATTTATVVNRPGPAASNSTKPMQTRVARSCGFHVPETLLTNDADKVRAFADRQGPIVYKAAGGTRTYTGMLDLTDTGRLERLSTCPTYFQRYIAGTNVRVHVVGAEAFAVEVISDAIDYRQHMREMVPIILPGPVADKCQAVIKTLELLIAGIDLIRGRDGEWYFLEANPSPAFTFYPGHDQVAMAIARLLSSRPQAHNRL